MEQEIKVGSVVSNDNNLSLYVVAEIATIKTINGDRLEFTCYPFDLKDRYAWQRREMYNEEEDGIELEYEPTEESLQFVRDQIESMESFDEDDSDEDEIYDLPRSKNRDVEMEEDDSPSIAEYEMDIEQLEKENETLVEKLEYAEQLVRTLVWISGGLVICFLIFTYFYLR